MDNEEVDLVAQKNADDGFSKSCFHGEYLNNYRLEYVMTRVLCSTTSVVENLVCH